MTGMLSALKPRLHPSKSQSPASSAATLGKANIIEIAKRVELEIALATRVMVDSEMQFTAQVVVFITTAPDGSTSNDRSLLPGEKAKYAASGT